MVTRTLQVVSRIPTQRSVSMENYSFSNFLEKASFKQRMHSTGKKRLKKMSIQCLKINVFESLKINHRELVTIEPKNNFSYFPVFVFRWTWRLSSYRYRCTGRNLTRWRFYKTVFSSSQKLR